MFDPLRFSPVDSTRLTPVAPVPDIRLYDTIYQERYMGLPQENPEELRRLIEAWNPMVPASMGLVAFIVILWLMLAKPF